MAAKWTSEAVPGSNPSTKVRRLPAPDRFLVPELVARLVCNQDDAKAFECALTVGRLDCAATDEARPASSLRGLGGAIDRRQSVIRQPGANLASQIVVRSAGGTYGLLLPDLEAQQMAGHRAVRSRIEFVLHFHRNHRLVADDAAPSRAVPATTSPPAKGSRPRASRLRTVSCRSGAAPPERPKKGLRMRQLLAIWSRVILRRARCSLRCSPGLL